MMIDIGKNSYDIAVESTHKMHVGCEQYDVSIKENTILDLHWMPAEGVIFGNG